MRDSFSMDDNVVAGWIQKIRDGLDEPLKGMLIALAPRLDEVNFIA